MLELLRVLGRGLSQAAESLRALPLKLVLEPGISERELAIRYADAGGAALSAGRPAASSNLLALHLRHATQSEVISAIERGGGRLPGSREVAVCFADLVGFTRLGEEVPRRRARPPRACAWKRSPARSPTRRCGSSRRSATRRCSPRPSPSRCSPRRSRLIDAADAEGEDFPQLRAGAAIGQALPRAGDWFGRPVNLASRITGVARPGSLLAERERARRRRRAVPLVVRRRAPAARHPRAGAAVPRARARQPAAAQRAGAPLARRAAGASSHTRHGALPALPHVVERDSVLVGVHALPEALVAVGAQLAVGGQALERLALEHAVALQVVEARPPGSRRSRR